MWHLGRFFANLRSGEGHTPVFSSGKVPREQQTLPGDFSSPEHEHRWQITAGIGLDMPPPPANPLATVTVTGWSTHAVRYCPECETVVVLE